MPTTDIARRLGVTDQTIRPQLNAQPSPTAPSDSKPIAA